MSQARALLLLLALLSAAGLLLTSSAGGSETAGADRSTDDGPGATVGAKPDATTPTAVSPAQRASAQKLVAPAGHARYVPNAPPSDSPPDLLDAAGLVRPSAAGESDSGTPLKWVPRVALPLLLTDIRYHGTRLLAATLPGWLTHLLRPYPSVELLVFYNESTVDAAELRSLLKLTLTTRRPGGMSAAQERRLAPVAFYSTGLENGGDAAGDPIIQMLPVNLTWPGYLADAATRSDLLNRPAWLRCGCPPYCPAKRASVDYVQGTRWYSYDIFTERMHGLLVDPVHSEKNGSPGQLAAERLARRLAAVPRGAESSANSSHQWTGIDPATDAALSALPPSEWPVSPLWRRYAYWLKLDVDIWMFRRFPLDIAATMRTSGVGGIYAHTGRTYNGNGCSNELRTAVDQYLGRAGRAAVSAGEKSFEQVDNVFYTNFVVTSVAFSTSPEVMALSRALNEYPTGFFRHRWTDQSLAHIVFGVFVGPRPGAYSLDWGSLRWARRVRKRRAVFRHGKAMRTWQDISKWI